MLLLVKVLYLVQIQQNAAGSGQRAHFRQNFLDILQGRRGSVQTTQRLLRAFGDNVGDGGFARARRTVKDHIGLDAALNQATQYRSRRKQMRLSYHVLQRFRAYRVRKRLTHS